MKKSNIGILVVLIAIIAVLILWSRFNSPDYVEIKRWEALGVDCLPLGHQNLAQHIHPNLMMIVDGDEVTIPANIGINRQCMAEIHTHDATGKIHIETVAPNVTFTLGDFFNVWGESFEKENYTVLMTVNGSTTEANPDHVFTDEEIIVLTYIPE